MSRLNWYGRLPANMWRLSRNWPDDLRDDARLALSYLTASEHSESSGFFHAPESYAITDLGWDSTRWRVAVAFLEKVGMILVDSASELILVKAAFAMQPPQNAAQSKALLRRLTGLPESPLLREFAEIVEHAASRPASTPQIVTFSRMLWGTVSLGVQRPSQMTYSDKNPNPNPNTNTNTSPDGGVVRGGDSVRRGTTERERELERQYPTLMQVE